VLAAAGLGSSVLLWQKVDGMQEQLARQTAESGTQATEARALARSPRIWCATPPAAWPWWKPACRTPPCNAPSSKS
jgi:hypothetical protein